MQTLTAMALSIPCLFRICKCSQVDSDCGSTLVSNGLYLTTWPATLAVLMILLCSGRCSLRGLGCSPLVFTQGPIHSHDKDA